MKALASKLLFASLLIGSLGGCANMFRGQVVTFHEGPLAQGESIAVERNH